MLKQREGEASLALTEGIDDEESRSSARLDCLLFLVGAGDLPEARRAWEEIESEDDRDQARLEIAVSMIGKGELEPALDLAFTTNFLATRCRVLKAAAVFSSRNRQAEIARQLFSKALTAAGELGEGSEELHFYSTKAQLIAETLISAQEEGREAGLVNQAIEIASDQGGHAQHKTPARIAQVQAGWGDVDSALRTVEHIDSDGRT